MLDVLRKILRSESDAEQRSILRDQRDILIDIRGEMKSANSSELPRKSYRVAVVTLAVTAIGVAIAAWTLSVTFGVREGVQDLASLEPQQVVDELRMGQTENEIRELLGREPAFSERIDGSESFSASFASERLSRRAIYRIDEHEFVVEVVFDSLLQARMMTITALGDDLKLAAPRGALGAFAQGELRTNETTVEEAVEMCPQLVGRSNVSPSWGHVSIGCPGYGYTEMTPSVVAANFAGPVGDYGTASVPAGLFDASTALQYMPAATFNSIAVVDRAVLATNVANDVSSLLEFEIGPKSGDPVG